MKQPKWTSEWPTKPGRYWFYGYRTKDSKKPKMLSVTARGVPGPKPIFITDGGTFFEHDAGPGKWTKVVMPEPPTLE